MADNLIEAFKRCEELSRRMSPEKVIEVMEAHERGEDVEPHLLEDVVRMLINRDALYGVKAGLSRAAFVSWCELAYELQSYLHAETDGDRAGVFARVQALRNATLHGTGPLD